MVEINSEDRSKIAREILKKYFGFESFRGMQEQVIMSLLQGRDVLLVMPTGGGKSLCYQVPAMIFKGVTLIISPLIALINDQVSSLERRGINAAGLTSQDSGEQINKKIEDIINNRVRIVYAAPERLSTGQFRKLLEKIKIDLVVVDEAHCISEWGHDFRPDYRRIGEIRLIIKNAPVLACTATAGPPVQEDVITQLQMKNFDTYISGFNRENLNYTIFHIKDEKEKFRTCLEILRKRGVPALIYCSTITTVHRLLFRLRNYGIRAFPFHAKIPEKIKNKIQKAFLDGSIHIVIATVAFGMGVDKPDIRVVIHYDFPGTVESYFQETGRAGRDGKPSECYLLYYPKDKFIHLYFIEKSNLHPQEEDIKTGEHTQINTNFYEKKKKKDLKRLDMMMRLFETEACIRASLLSYFGETFPDRRCMNCSNCLGIKDVSEIPLKKDLASSGLIEQNTDHELWNRLNILRKEIAEKEGIPLFYVIPDSCLQKISESGIKSVFDLLMLQGASTHFIEKYIENGIDRRTKSV